MISYICFQTEGILSALLCVNQGTNPAPSPFPLLCATHKVATKWYTHYSSLNFAFFSYFPNPWDSVSIYKLPMERIKRIGSLAKESQTRPGKEGEAKHQRWHNSKSNSEDIHSNHLLEVRDTLSTHAYPSSCIHHPTAETGQIFLIAGTHICQF